MPKRNKILAKECPFEAAMDAIGGKWKGMILYQLLPGTKRFNELKTLMPGITQRMLALQLKELEKSQLVLRKAYLQIPPKVEYSLTNLGKSLETALLQVNDWGKIYIQKKTSIK